MFMDEGIEGIKGQNILRLMVNWVQDYGWVILEYVVEYNLFILKRVNVR